MILKDALVAGWLGSVGEALHYPLPLALGGVVTLLGWWFTRGARAGAQQHG